MTFGPRTRISPSAAMRTSTPGSGLPTVPRRGASIGLPEIPGELSVSP